MGHLRFFFGKLLKHFLLKITEIITDFFTVFQLNFTDFFTDVFGLYRISVITVTVTVTVTELFTEFRYYRPIPKWMAL